MDLRIKNQNQKGTLRRPAARCIVGPQCSCRLCPFPPPVGPGALARAIRNQLLLQRIYAQTLHPCIHDIWLPLTLRIVS